MPIVRFLIILAILPISATAQVTVSGRVFLCEDFFTGITVKNKLSYIAKKNKKKNFTYVLDTLQPDIIIRSGETQILTTQTDPRGGFEIALTPNSTYQFRFRLADHLFRDTTISVEHAPINFSICIPDSGFHNFFLRKIPFDSIRAKIDIEHGLVRIISLSGKYSSTGTRILDVIGKDEINKIQDKFGFIFESHYLDDIFPKYLEQRENEYNKVVLQFLDEKLQYNSWELIREEIRDALRRRKQSRSEHDQ